MFSSYHIHPIHYYDHLIISFYHLTISSYLFFIVFFFFSSLKKGGLNENTDTDEILQWFGKVMQQV